MREGGAHFLRMVKMAAAVAGRVNLALLLLAVFCATFWITDAAVNRQPPPQGATAPAAPARPESRMLVLLIDSLRYETATDPAFMPRLCALAREGAAAKVKPSFTPATAPSVRDIFTGRANQS